MARESPRSVYRFPETGAAVLAAYVLNGIASPPRVGRPQALDHDEKGTLTMPVLLVLGDKDNLVGDPSDAARRSQDFPNIRIDVLHSGHLVGVEQANLVNQLIVEFYQRGGLS